MNDRSDPAESDTADTLEDRVQRIEQRLSEMQYTIDRIAFTQEHRGNRPPLRPRPPATEPPRVRADRRPAEPAPPTAEPAGAGPSSSGTGWDLSERSSEFWLSRIGIGLVLFGVAFLFKYAVDQGWLVPTLRVTLGGVLGAGLYLTGVRLQTVRPWFSRVLLGGGIGALYITAYAATQLYNLLPYAVGFAAMVGITVLAYVSAMWQDQPVLSIIGAVGGFGTPFVLETEAGSVAGFAAYLGILVVGTSAIVATRKWDELAFTAFVGAWGAFAIAQLAAGASPQRVWLQVAAVAAWLSLWIAPSLAAVQPIAERANTRALGAVQMLTPAGAVAALGFSLLLWDPEITTPWGWVALGGTVVYAGAIAVTERLQRRDLSYVNAGTSALLVAVALGLLLEGQWLLVAWAAQATVLHFLGRHLGDARPIRGGQILFVVTTIWLVARLVKASTGGPPFVNSAGLTDAAVLGAIAVSSRAIDDGDERTAYLLMAHVGLLAWLWRELEWIANGPGLVTVAWGVYGIGVLVIGLTRARLGIARVGLATLFVVVAKLFLVDLAGVDGLWRIMLFLGFGGAFLALSYLFRGLWRAAAPPHGPPTISEETGG